jgi:hypothetical protein
MKCCELVTAAACHCGLCHQTFSGIGLFDAHQDVDYHRQPVIICRSPAVLGLAQEPGGTWCTPEGLKARESYRGRLAMANSARRGRS